MLDPVVRASGNSIKLLNPEDDTASAILMSAGPLQSSIKVIDPVDKREGFVLSSETSGNSLKLRDPVNDVITLIEMSGGIDGNATYKMFNPQPEPPAVLMEMNSSPMNGANFNIYKPEEQTEGIVQMGYDPTKGGFLEIHAAEPALARAIRLTGTPADTGKITMFGGPHGADYRLLELRSHTNEGGSISFFDDLDNTLLSLSSAPSIGGSIKMFNPQPEPPAVFMELNTDQYGANFAMTAPQAGIGPGEEITDPLFELTVDSSGANLNLFNAMGKLIGFEPTPFTPDGGRFRMYDPVADDVKFEAVSTEDGASIDIYDEIGKYMGFDPSPFTPGGYLYLIKSSGLAVDTNITLGSDGYIWVENGVTIGSNANSGTHTLVMGANTSASGENCFAGGREAQANHDHCFVWSDNPFGPSMVTLQTSNENQFLVRSTGTIAFYTNMNLTHGVSLGPGDYAWNSIVPPLTSRNSRDIDGADILDKIEQLPLKRFSADGETDHISPSPEDFNRLFDTGTTENQISMQDQSGIALAGIKEMINIINDLKDKNAELERRITELERSR